MSTMKPMVKSESNSVLYNIELENDSESGYDCIDMDEFHDNENEQANDTEDCANSASNSVHSSSDECEKEDHVVQSDRVSGDIDEKEAEELAKILDAFSVHSDDDAKSEKDNSDSGTVSSAMIYNLAKSVQYLKDEDTLDRSHTSSKFLGKVDDKNGVEFFVKANDCSKSKVGNLLGISSCVIPNSDGKRDNKSHECERVEQSIDEDNADDMGQSTITILSSVHGNIDSPASKIDTDANNSTQISSFLIEEKGVCYSTTHKKICVVFLGLFLITVFAFVEKIYQKNIALERLELSHNEKILRMSKECEDVYTRLQIELDTLLQENEKLKLESEKFKLKDPKQMREFNTIFTESMNNNCNRVSKFEPNDYAIFEDEEDEGYQLNFKSCWGEMGISYKTGQCTSDLKDFVSQGVSNTRNTIKKFVHGTPSTEFATTRENLISDKIFDDPVPSIAFLVGNETYDFTTLMYKIATEPIKTTRDVLKNAIDLAKESFHEN